MNAKLLSVTEASGTLLAFSKDVRAGQPTSRRHRKYWAEAKAKRNT
jgi:hypothetical protein